MADVEAPRMPRSWDATMIGVKIGVNGVHELVTLSNLRRIARSSSQRRVATRNLMENELTDCFASRLTVIFGVRWRRIGWSGAEWMASMASMATIAAHEGTDVELWCLWWWRRVAPSGGWDRLTKEGTPSRDECTHRSSLFDRQQTTSCFRCWGS